MKLLIYARSEFMPEFMQYLERVFPAYLTEFESQIFNSNVQRLTLFGLDHRNAYEITTELLEQLQLPVLITIQSSKPETFMNTFSLEGELCTSTRINHRLWGQLPDPFTDEAIEGYRLYKLYQRLGYDPITQQPIPREDAETAPF